MEIDLKVASSYYDDAAIDNNSILVFNNPCLKTNEIFSERNSKMDKLQVGIMRVCTIITVDVGMDVDYGCGD